MVLHNVITVDNRVQINNLTNSSALINPMLTTAVLKNKALYYNL